MLDKRANASVLTSGKKEKNIISPSTLNFAVRGGKFGISYRECKSQVCLSVSKISAQGPIMCFLLT